MHQRILSREWRDTHRMGESICKHCDQKGVSFQNLQPAHEAQYQKFKQLNQKISYAYQCGTVVGEG